MEGDGSLVWQLLENGQMCSKDGHRLGLLEGWQIEGAGSIEYGQL